MKNLNIKSSVLFLGTLAAAAGCFTACDDGEDKGKYGISGGNPEVYYVRLPDAASSDSLLVGAYMENTICLVGKNLNSIKEIYFNDQKAILNISLITSNSLFVTVPKTIPSVVTDKMYFVNNSLDTTSYDFKVLVPEPVVNSMSCEYAKEGDIAVLYGDYFIDDPNSPLKITMAGNVAVEEITSIEKTQVAFRIPQGAGKGYLTVSSIYGTGRSKFQYLDDRNVILDWDNTTGNGWRAGIVADSEPAGISGKYVKFGGSATLHGDNSDWDEDNFSFNLWGASGLPEGDLFDIDPSNAVLKFEVNVPQAWSAQALQMIFTPWATTGTNGYIADGTTPRGLWMPWETEGAYTTDGWITVSFNLSDFKYSHTGATLEMAGAGNYGGLTFFVYHGGIAGTDCTPLICIDNIRVVPAE